MGCVGGMSGGGGGMGERVVEVEGYFTFSLLELYRPQLTFWMQSF